MLTPSSGIATLTAETDELANDAEASELGVHTVADVLRDWDLLTDALQFSPSVRSVFRVPHAESVDDIHWWVEHIHPEDRDAVLAGIHNAIGGREQFWSAEYRFARGDGTYARVSDRGLIVRDDAGQPVRMVGCLSDMTEQRTVDAALRDSERRFRSLIENASDAIAIIGADGRFIFASASYREVLGFDPADLEGREVLELVHEDDVSTARSSLGRIVAEPDATVHITLRCRHKDGSWRVLDARARNLLDDPSVRGIVAASRDITQQRMLETELVQSQKMEAVGKLAGGVAHDFNNLLTVISTNVELIVDSIPAQSPVHESLAEIRRAAGQAAGLTRELLNFTQRRSGDPQVVDLNEVVNDAHALLRRVLASGSEVRVNTAARTPLVKIDRAQLDQVLMNLIFNARDALESGGLLEVSTERQTVVPGDLHAPAGIPPGEYSVLCVQDTGTGMTPETRACAFDPFFTTKPLGKGTGLGLTMVYAIVRHAGGFIDLTSRLGEGTTFRIYLPRVMSPKPTPPNGSRLAPELDTRTVLLVEDEDMVRKVVRRTLASRGYTVIEATNGTEGLGLVLQDPARISLVVTDVMMPSMGGPELARRLWARFPEMKIIFLSGYTPDTMSAESAVPPGAILIEKPFAVEKLLTTVRDVLASPDGGTLRSIDTTGKTD